MDADARCVARTRFYRRDLLRRSGLHGAQKDEGHQRQESEGCRCLRAVRHDHREEPERLQQEQRPAHEAGRVREAWKRRVKAFFSGRCQAYTTDASGLASIRNKEASNPDDYVILPELISKEPLGPAVRRGDDEWFAIAKWVVFALIEAEEYGITQANVDKMKASTDPAVQRILGTGEDMGKLLGLDKEWAYRAIKSVGNYGEIFERNVGPKSALQLPRGLNNLWNKGGIMYAPPIR